MNITFRNCAVIHQEQLSNKIHQHPRKLHFGFFTTNDISASPSWRDPCQRKARSNAWHELMEPRWFHQLGEKPSIKKHQETSRNIKKHQADLSQIFRTSNNWAKQHFTFSEDQDIRRNLAWTVGCTDPKLINVSLALAVTVANLDPNMRSFKERSIATTVVNSKEPPTE